MQAVTTPKKIMSIFVVITFLSKSASGIDKPTTAIEKAIAVPIGIPFCTNTSIIGKTPAALLYIGTPARTATGTAKGLSAVIYSSKKPVGIKPCIAPPIAIPITIYKATPFTIDNASLIITGSRCLNV